MNKIFFKGNLLILCCLHKVNIMERYIHHIKTDAKTKGDSAKKKRPPVAKPVISSLNRDREKSSEKQSEVVVETKKLTKTASEDSHHSHHSSSTSLKKFDKEFDVRKNIHF